MAAAGVTAEIARPGRLEASAPPEARGLARDQVRLLVSNVARGSTAHARFRDLPRWLAPGDLLVVNTSGTLNAAVTAITHAGETLEIHLSTALPGGFWTVEVRKPGDGASRPCRENRTGQELSLPAGGRVTLLAPYPVSAGPDALEAASRLWMAALRVPGPVPAYLARHGRPIRYRYVTRAWPAEVYQTVFAREWGSAEMPSAGRPFTTGLVARLLASGVRIAPILLHTGVSSLEDHEPPYEEFYRVPRETAEAVDAARRAGRRVIAVGTTVVRALETVTDDRGTFPGEGWTGLVVSPGRRLRSVDGLITGFHEPGATHLAMLDGLLGERMRADAYRAALGAGYLWHEFGDSHLILRR